MTPPAFVIKRRASRTLIGDAMGGRRFFGILPDDGRPVKVGGSALIGVGGDALQDLQELSTIGGTIQKSGSEVQGHGRMLVWVGGVFRGAAVPIGSAFQLRQRGGGDVRGGTTGAVEVYHALRLLLGGEPLGAPLTLIVGGLVTDFEAHGLGCVVVVL